MQHVLISGLYIVCWLSTKEIARAQTSPLPLPLPLGRKMFIEYVLDCAESAVLNFEQANALFYWSATNVYMIYPVTFLFGTKNQKC